MATFEVTPAGALAPLPLPKDISESYVDCMEDVGLNFHILESGIHGQPLVILLHGFPELAYSWRKVMATITHAGFYVVAPDQRGYGRTTGWDDSGYYFTDLEQFMLSSYARDIGSLVKALGYSEVRCVVGHDMGSAVAAACAVSQTEVFRSCILMSHPYKGAPKATPTSKQAAKSSSRNGSRSTYKYEIYRDPYIETSLANLDPPRKPYKWYNAQPRSAVEWEMPRQGLARFLRGYFHLKSADWYRNKPHPLKAWSAPELAQMPGYYVMPLSASMPETIERDMEDEDERATEDWLSQDDLEVYVQEWSRTGFQGGLNFYRIATGHFKGSEPAFYFSERIKCPMVFISGDKDWGNHQDPGALDGMRKFCDNFKGIQMVKGAGHWPQQEQPGPVAAYILGFLWTIQSSSTPSRTKPIMQVQTPGPSERGHHLPNNIRDIDMPMPPVRTSAGPSRHPNRADTPIMGPGYRPESQLPRSFGSPRNRAGSNTNRTPARSTSRSGSFSAHETNNMNAEIYKHVSEQPRSRSPATPFDTDSIGRFSTTGAASPASERRQPR